MLQQHRLTIAKEIQGVRDVLDQYTIEQLDFLLMLNAMNKKASDEMWALLVKQKLKIEAAEMATEMKKSEKEEPCPEKIPDENEEK